MDMDQSLELPKLSVSDMTKKFRETCVSLGDHKVISSALALSEFKKRCNECLDWTAVYNENHFLQLACLESENLQRIKIGTEVYFVTAVCCVHVFL